MKRLFVLVSTLALFGCTVSVNSTNDDTTRRGPNPVDASQMQFKTASGYQTSPLSSVSSVEVAFTGPNDGTVQVMRLFEGTYAQAILRQLNLNAPQEPGLPGNVTTGWITIRSGSTVLKKFWILSSGVLQDVDFREALYRPAVELTQAWLMAQKPLASTYNVAHCLYHVDTFGKWQMNTAFGMPNVQLGQDDSHVAGGMLTNARTGYCNLIGGTGRETSLAVVMMTATANDTLTMSQPCKFFGDGLAVSNTDKNLGIGETAFVDFRVEGVLHRNLVYLATKGEANAPSWANSACLRFMSGFTLN